jgi:hypothetical protein
MDDEKIVAAAPGRYFSGLALLVATDQRLLLIDKRAFFMNVEDTRYDMISEINFGSRLYDASVHIYTLNKQHNFTSMRYKHQLRDLTNYIQQRVWELRQDSKQQINAPALADNRDMFVQTQQPQPQVAEIVKRIPKPHMPKVVGSTAMYGSRRYDPNPYVRR